MRAGVRVASTEKRRASRPRDDLTAEAIARTLERPRNSERSALSESSQLNGPMMCPEKETQ